MDVRHPLGRDISSRVEELIRRRAGTRADAVARSSALEGERHAVSPCQIGITFDIWSDLEFEHPFLGLALAGTKERAWAHGADLTLLRPFPRNHGGAHDGQPAVPEDPEWYVRRCRALGLDGIIIFGLPTVWSEVSGLVSSGIPCVAIDDYLLGARASSVSSDNVGGARQAVGHLLSLGRRRIGTLTGALNVGAASDRQRGWQIELESAGLHAHEELSVDCDWLEDRAYEGTRRLLELPEPVDAVFAQSDLMAVGALRAINAAGLRVPGDVAVVGFDDSPLAEMTRPPLTSVRQDPLGLGIAAAEVLFHIIDAPEEPVPVAVVSVELVVRGSTVDPCRATQRPDPSLSARDRALPSGRAR
ncbi:MAG: substrate-binding domain-containing protein [Gaiellaceae bacterium]